MSAENDTAIESNRSVNWFRTREVLFSVSCGYPTCHPLLRGVCISSRVCDPSEVPVACHRANVSRLEVGDEQV